MIEELVEFVLRGVIEVACYWVGKFAVLPFGFRCSLDDEWGVRRKKRGKSKPPWTWIRTERRYLRSDLVQLIGLMIIGAIIAGIVVVALNLPAGTGS
ncbi:MAG: hypothetical protein H0W78_10045 [Planctomycetes bacterium]|nr:hypothetical protein [Planctomycetota bacterium]